MRSFQSALRFAVVSDLPLLHEPVAAAGLVSIRFEVRGGFRQVLRLRRILIAHVSIRFEVRGGFRRQWLLATHRP